MGLDADIVAVDIMAMDTTEIAIKQDTLIRSQNPTHEVGITHKIKGIDHGIDTSMNLMVVGQVALLFLEAGEAQIEGEGLFAQEDLKVGLVRKCRELQWVTRIGHGLRNFVPYHYQKLML